MTRRLPPITPDALRLAEALDRSAPMVRLRTLLADSNARFDTVRPVLPAALTAHVRPGPLDDTGWSLLAANAAVAAKLRQLQPRIETALRDAGWMPSAVRIKVVPPAEDLRRRM